MTACVNDNQKKGGYGKAVSATLAGVLAVGMVPATALAADGDATVTSDEGIDLLAGATDVFKNGSITMAESGAIVSGKTPSFTYNGKAQALVPTEVTTADGTVVDVTGSNYEITYKDSSGKTVEADDIIDAGNYTVTVAATGGTYKGQTLASPLIFTIKQANLNTLKVTPYVVETEGEVSETVPVYNGKPYTIENDVDGIWFAVDGEPLDEESVDSTVSIVSPANTSDIEYAGTYVVQIEAADSGNYTGYLQTSVTVEKYNLSEVVLTGTTLTGDVTAQTTLSEEGQLTADGQIYDGSEAVLGITAVNGAAVSDDNEAWKTLQALMTAKAAEVSFTTDTNNDLVFPNDDTTLDNGTYTFTMAATEPASGATADEKAAAASIEGSATFDITIAEEEAAIYYSAPTLLSDAKVNTNYSEKDTKVFDASKISAKYDSDKEINSDDLKISVYNTVTNEVATVEDLTKTPGKYAVTVTVDSAALDYAAGGTASMTVTVTQGTVDWNSDVFVTYDGKNWNDIAAVYTGENLIPEIGVKVLSTTGTVLTEGTDYELIYENQDGEEVDSIVDANTNGGNYTLTVKSLGTYEPKTDGVTTNTIDITVSPIVASNLRVANTETINGYSPALAYTGSAITPVIEYGVTKNDVTTWKTLPADTYKLSYKSAETLTSALSTAKTMQDTGYYQITIAPTGDNSNYDVSSTTLSNLVWVTDWSRFKDVPSTAWFYDAVNEAASAGYIKGYNNGNLFGPNDAIKRGDVAMVLARMGGVKLAADDDAISEIGGFVTPFKDVDPNLYYAQAIAWCANTGIVTGYGDTGLFKPEAPVTREEFATMLARYAKACGTDIEADADVLKGYADASAVADWAKPFVEWAVSDEIMGVNTTVLWPLNNVSRAEVAAMAVRYQPEAKTAPVAPSTPSEQETPSITIALAEGSSATLAKSGDTVQLVDTQKNVEKDQTVTWKSSDEAVATVDKNGEVTAVASGTADITATITVDGKTYTSNSVEITVS